MAFVPKVHNREVPVSNRHIYWRQQRERQDKHLQYLNQMQPRIDNKWGCTYNGVKEQKQATYAHVRSNLKRAQIQDERYAEIELENYLLLEKLSRILERSHNPTQGTHEWGAGVRLDANQVPVIDHCVPQTTNAFGAAIESTSLNVGSRQQEQDRIAKENRELVRRLQACRPTYDKDKFESDARERDRMLQGRAAHWQRYGGAHHGPLASTLAKPYFQKGLRPHSAPTTQPAPGSSGAGQLVPGGRPAPVAASSVRRPPRPATAKPRQQGSRPKSPLDPSVASILHLLTRQMAGEKRTMEQARVARDSLMENGPYQVPDSDFERLELLPGVNVEVVQPGRATRRSGSDELIVMMVHGGMFSYGSARGLRHLAHRVSCELGVAVVTPDLPLSPENVYPTAPNQLEQVYRHIVRHGLQSSDALAEFRRADGDGDGAVSRSEFAAYSATVKSPRRIALFAESSGCALALSLMAKLVAEGGEAAGGSSSAEGVAPVCGLVMVSPWLDMTCSGGSFVVNHTHDPVLTRKTMVDIAQVYLNQKPLRNGPLDPLAPEVSPLFVPAEILGRLPPTLIHVGDTEVLLDDSRSLHDKMVDAGGRVSLVEFKHVLHSWHSFFPVMGGKAVEAVEGVIEFLRVQLQLPAEPAASLTPVVESPALR